MYLREDAVSGMSYLENQSEVRAPTADVAAHLLDAAIAARTVPRQCTLFNGVFLPRDAIAKRGICHRNSVHLSTHPSDTFILLDVR